MANARPNWDVDSLVINPKGCEVSGVNGTREICFWVPF